MKTLRQYRTLLGWFMTCLMMLWLPMQTAHGSTIYWDLDTTGSNNSLTGTSLIGGNGIWDNGVTGQWWNGSSFVDTTWNNANNDTAVFWGTAGFANLSSAITVGGLQFNTSGYTLSDSTLNFGATGTNNIVLDGGAGVTATGAAVTATINSTLSSVSGANVNVNGGAYSGIIAGTLNLVGSGAGFIGGLTIGNNITLGLVAPNVSATGNLPSTALSNISSLTLGGGSAALTISNGVTDVGVTRINASAGITSNGGTINYVNTAGAVNYAMTLGALTLGASAGQTNIVTTNATNAGSTEILTLASLSNSSGTGNITFGLGGFVTGTAATVNQTKITAQATTTNTIIGPWATVGTTAANQVDYATYNYSGGTMTTTTGATTGGAVIATGINGANVTAVTAFPTASVYSNTANMNLNNGTTTTTLAAAVNLNTLRYTGGASTVALSTFPLGTFGILQAGTGTLTLTGSATGVITLPTAAPGNLYLTTGTAFGIIDTSAPINNNGANALTLVLSGQNTVTLTVATSNYSGGTIMNSGTVSIPANGSLGAVTGGLTFDGNAGLTFTAATTLGTAGTPANRAITFNNGAIATITTGAFNSVLDGNISGTGGFILAGTNGNTLTVGQTGSTNTASGPIQISQGTLLLGVAGALGNTSNAVNILNVAGPTLNLNNFATTIGSLSGGGTAGGTVTLGTATLTVGGNGESSIFAGTITGAGGLTKSGAGVMTLNPALNVNTTALSTASTTLTVPTVGLAPGMVLTGGIGTGIPVGATIVSITSGTALVLSQPVTVASGTVVNFIGNSYTGGTTVNGGGFINAANVTAFGASGGITLDNGGIQYAANNSIASLDMSSREITFGPGGASFDTNANSAVLANEIGNGGTGGLTKYGYGTLFLQGNNTYTGATTINGGALNLSNGGALGTGTAGVTVNVGALVLQGGNDFGAQPLTLNGSGFSAGQSGALVNASGANFYDGSITLGSSSTISVDAGTLTLNGSGISGTGTLTLTGAGSGSGIANASIVNASIGVSGGLNVTGTGTWLLAGSSSSYPGSTFVGAGSTLIFLGGALGSTGTTLGGGTLQMYDGSGSQNIGNLGFSAGVNTIIVGASDAITSGSTITRATGATVKFDTSSGGTISTTATGTGANKVLGYALVNNGTTTGLASIGSGGALGVLLSSGYTVLANNSTDSTLDFTTNGMSPNALAWNSTVTNVSADSLTFDTTGASANQSVALNGTLTLTSGAIVVNATNANTSLLSGGQVGATNSEVIVHQLAASGNAAAFTISSLVSGGTGSYLQDGTGTVILAGANTYTGATTINGGTLKAGIASQITFGTSINNTTQGFLQSSGAFGLGSAVTIASGATLDLNGFNTIIGTLSGAGNLVLTNGATLTTGGYSQSGNISGAQLHTSFSGLISGTGNLVLTGSGTLALTNAGNSFSGSVTINSGTLEISDMHQLGTGTGQISVNGNASTAGLPGGTLVVQGGASGLTFNRNLTLAGRGPNTVGGALVSIGPNTFSGTFTAGVVATGEARVVFEGGNNTITGSVFTSPVAAGDTLLIYGDSNVTVSGLLTGGTTGQTGIIKTGSVLANSITLTNANNNYLGNIRLDAGTVRVFNGGALGMGTDVNAIRFNNGTLEVRTEAPTSFSTRNVSLPDNNGVIFVDRGIGGSGLGVQQISSAGALSFASASGNVTFQNLTMTAAAARTLTLTGRDGYGATFTGVNGSTGNITGGNEAFTNSSNGLLIINSSISLGDGTARTLTINGNSDTVVNGYLISVSTGDHTFTKSSQGYLLMNGTNTTAASNSSFTDGTNITGGTLAVTSIKTLLNQNSTTTTGSNNVLTLNGGALSYLGTTTTGAGETTPMVINLTGTTGAGIILANQTGTSPSALIFQSSVGAGGAGIKTLFLGGSTPSSVINQIQGVIQSNTAANTTSLAKSGSDTWLYAPAVSSYTALSSGVTVTGLGAANTNTIQVSSAAGLALGQVVTAGGTNVPTAGVITNINGTTITLSSNITAAITAGAAITFGASTNFTGSVTVGGGTLQVQPTAASGASGGNLFINTQNLIFNTDALTLNGYAGGTFELMTPSATLAASLSQTMGLLQLSAGAGKVQVDAGNSTFSNILSFNGYTTRTAGAVANFAPAATLAGIQFAVLPTAISSGMLSGVYFTNPTTSAIDFAGTAAINTNIAALGSPTGALLATGSVGTGNYSVSGGTTFSTTGADVANTIRISGGSSLSLGANLTITSTTALVMGGILQDNAGGASTISSTGAFTIAPVTANQELLIITGGAGTNANPLLTTNTLTISSVLAAGTGPVTKAGGGILVLSGQNTFTGALTIDEGVLRASGTNTQTLGAPAVGTVDVLRQNAYLDVNAAGAPTAPYTNGTSIATLIAASINGAGFITTTASGAQAIQFGASTSTAASAVFSGIISNGSGTMTVIRNGASGSQALTGLNTYTGATILSGGATLQATILANGGVASSIGQSTNSAANLVFNGGTLQYTGSSATIYQVTQTPSVSIDRLFTLAGNGTIDSSGTYGNDVLAASVQNNAALIFNNTGAAVFANVGAKTLTLTGTSLGDNELDLLLQNNTIDSTALSLTKTGTSLWILGGVSNTYSGTTTITQGMLRAQDGAGLSSNSNLLFNGAVGNDVALEMSGTFTRAIGTAAGQVQWAPNLSGGFAAGTAPLVVNFGGANAQVSFGAGGIGNGTGALILNSTTAQSDVTISNPINLNGGVRTVQVQDNTSSNYDFATLSGVISGSAGSGLTKTGAGTLYISGANTYEGNTNLTNGSTFVSTIGGGSKTSSAFGAGNGTLNLGTASATVALFYTGSGETANRQINLTSGAGQTTRIAASGSGALVLTNFTNVSTGRAILDLRGFSNDANMITSTINDSGGALQVTKSDGGTWVLTGSNTYSGGTQINSGFLGVASTAGAAGTSSSIGVTGPTGLVGGANNLVNFTLSSGTTAGLNVGMNVTGAGIAFGDVITGITDSTHFTISTARTTPNAGATYTNLYFGSLLFSNGGLYSTNGPLTINQPMGIAANTSAEFAGPSNITLNGIINGFSGNPWNITNIIGTSTASGTLTINSQLQGLETATARNFSLFGTGNTIFNGSLINVNGPVGVTVNMLNNLTWNPTTTTTNLVSTTNATTTVTVSSTAGLYQGMLVTGTGIPANTTITAITSATAFTLSQAATTSATPTLSYQQNFTNGFVLNAGNVTNTRQSPVTFGTGALTFGGGTLQSTVDLTSTTGNALLDGLQLNNAYGVFAGTSSFEFSGNATLGYSCRTTAAPAPFTTTSAAAPR